MREIVRRFQSSGLKKAAHFSRSDLGLMDRSNGLLLANDDVDSAATKRLQWAEVGRNDCLEALVLLALQAVELEQLEALIVDEEI